MFSKSLLISASSLLLLLLASGSTSAQSADEICFYSESNYSGKETCITGKPKSSFRESDLENASGVTELGSDYDAGGVSFKFGSNVKSVWVFSQSDIDAGEGDSEDATPTRYLQSKSFINTGIDGVLIYLK